MFYRLSNLGASPFRPTLDTQNIFLSINSKLCILRWWHPCWWRMLETKYWLQFEDCDDQFDETFVILQTNWCWRRRFYDGDRFEMLVTESSCWWLFVNSCFWCIKSVIKIFKLSPILRLQHPSSTWVSPSRNTQIRMYT